jgi:hypothetical protein
MEHRVASLADRERDRGEQRHAVVLP